MGKLWRLALIVVCVVPVSIGAWLMLKPWSPRAFPKLFPANQTLSIGHRGGGGLAPENTLHAFREAQQVGVDSVEFDVMLSADGHVVVFHDYTLEKRLFGKGRIRKMTLAQIRKVDVSAYYTDHKPLRAVPAKFQPSRIPTLKEVFAFYKAHPKVLLNIELKNEDLRDHGLESSVAQQIRRFGFEDRVVISSFNPFSVWRFRKAAPSIPRALIFSNDNPVYIRKLWFLALAQPDALHPQHEVVTPKFMKWARSKGYAVNSWTVNQPEDMGRLLDLGVNGIITDFPDRLAEVRRQEKVRKGRR